MSSPNAHSVLEMQYKSYYTKMLRADWVYVLRTNGNRGRLFQTM
jgi:hypothetical protein